jgi:hypothetical protein
MKKLLIIGMAIVAIFAGCKTAGKLVATSSVTVDKALRAWAVYYVDNEGTANAVTPKQLAAVEKAQSNYYMAEDQAIAAYASFVKNGDEGAWKAATSYLREQQQSLIQLIETFTKGKVTQ